MGIEVTGPLRIEFDQHVVRRFEDHMPSITVSVDPQVYRLTAVKKAAYRLGGRCSARIEVLSDGSIRVELTPKSEAILLPTLEGDFWTELVDQDLRESIAEQTERVRNLLLAQAFSGVLLIDRDAETADHRNDPKGIGRSQAEEI